MLDAIEAFWIVVIYAKVIDFSLTLFDRLTQNVFRKVAFSLALTVLNGAIF